MIRNTAAPARANASKASIGKESVGIVPSGGPGIAVEVGIAVLVGVEVGVDVAVAVGVGVEVGVDVAVAVAVEVGVDVAVAVAVAVAVGVGVGVTTANSMVRLGAIDPGIVPVPSDDTKTSEAPDESTMSGVIRKPMCVAPPLRRDSTNEGVMERLRSAGSMPKSPPPPTFVFVPTRTLGAVASANVTWPSPEYIKTCKFCAVRLEPPISSR